MNFLVYIKLRDENQVAIVHPERQTQGTQLKQRKRSGSFVFSFKTKKTKEHLGKKFGHFV